MGKVKKNKGGGGTKRKAKQAKARSFKGNANATRRGFNSSSTPGHGGNSGESNAKVDNPFEIRMSRTKHDNLGRRARHEKGLPGISRSKAIEKRRETLLQEYKIRNKSSLLVDKRIGEKIKNMSEEEKIIQRSVMEKRRQYKQKSIFNLPSTNDILTHKGQLLTDIDRYEDPRDESDSEDERLNEEFVSDAHFSGDFMKVKAKPDEEDEDDQKSRKDIIAELILNSKTRKMEKAKEADENYELVSKLDQEFKTPDFRNLLTFVQKGGSENRELTAKKEQYDKLVRELQFETKTGLASNRLKTQEEIEEEELLQLKKLENERINRMRAQDPTTPSHRSADELTDGFELTEHVPTISYQLDGKLNKNESDSDSEEINDEEQSVAEESDEDSDASDALSDLESENEEVVTSKKFGSLVKSVGKRTDLQITPNDDIPFTISLPKSYESFKKLMTKYKAFVKEDEIFVSRFQAVIERMVKYNLLAERNRTPDLFVYAFMYVLDGIDEVQSVGKNVKTIVDIVTVSLHSVLLTNSVKCVELMEREILKPRGTYEKSKQLQLSNIVMYQICAKLFCVTDFCHRILSPVKVQILSTINSVTSCGFTDLVKLLSLVDVIHELSNESKRYCPEVFKLLLDVLETLLLPHEKLLFKRRRFEFLKFTNLQTSNEESWETTGSSIFLTDEDIDPSTNQVLHLLLCVFDLIKKLLDSQYRTKAFNDIRHKFLITEKLVLQLKWENVSFHKALFSKRLPRDALLPQGASVEDDLPVTHADRPKMIKLYEPMIEDNFDGNKRKKFKRKGQTQEEARLSHKVKKEMKSAVREILKDNAFLAKQQLKEQAMKDAERNRRVKELLGSLSNQEGDYRKLKKQK